jgi:hypothetical protein
MSIDLDRLIANARAAKPKPSVGIPYAYHDVRDGQHGVICPECDTFIVTVQRKDFESFTGTEFLNGVVADCINTTTEDTTMPSYTEITTLRHEALAAGDLRMAMVCELAIEGEYGDAEPGTEMDDLRQEGMTRQEALALCAEALADAADLAVLPDDEDDDLYFEMYQQHYAEHHTAAGRLKALAAEAIRLAEDEDAWGTEPQITAALAYVTACEAAGYRWEEDPEAVDFAYVGAKATEAEMTAFTLPRALRALEGA